jgi:Outer membrane protein transport protein (OMPP1/FadL/TodX).
VGRIL